jgi:hypothetical protein
MTPAPMLMEAAQAQTPIEVVSAPPLEATDTAKCKHATRRHGHTAAQVHHGTCMRLPVLYAAVLCCK